MYFRTFSITFSRAFSGMPANRDRSFSCSDLGGDHQLQPPLVALAQVGALAGSRDSAHGPGLRSASRASARTSSCRRKSSPSGPLNSEGRVGADAAGVRTPERNIRSRRPAARPRDLRDLRRFRARRVRTRRRGHHRGPREVGASASPRRSTGGTAEPDAAGARQAGRCGWGAGSGKGGGSGGGGHGDRVGLVVRGKRADRLVPIPGRQERRRRGARRREPRGREPRPRERRGQEPARRPPGEAPPPRAGHFSARRRGRARRPRFARRRDLRGVVARRPVHELRERCARVEALSRGMSGRGEPLVGHHVAFDADPRDARGLFPQVAQARRHRLQVGPLLLVQVEVAARRPRGSSRRRRPRSRRRGRRWRGISRTSP